MRNVNAKHENIKVLIIQWKIEFEIYIVLLIYTVLWRHTRSFYWILPRKRS